MKSDMTYTDLILAQSRATEMSHDELVDLVNIYQHKIDCVMEFVREVNATASIIPKNDPIDFAVVRLLDRVQANILFAINGR